LFSRESLNRLYPPLYYFVTNFRQWIWFGTQALVSFRATTNEYTRPFWNLNRLKGWDRVRFLDSLGAVAADAASKLPPAVECPTWIASLRSSAAVSSARSSARILISLPFHGWLERAWPRRSCAIPRNPLSGRNNWSSKASQLSVHPWLKKQVDRRPQSL
jgi:hypothetical protein